MSVWHKQLADGGKAVALLNMGLFDASGFNLTYNAQMIGECLLGGGVAKVRPGLCTKSES